MRRLLLLFLLASPAMAQRIVLITGGTVTANVTDSADFYVTLNQNVTGVTLTSTVTPATGYLVSMKFVQDATGSRTVAFGGNISTSCVVNSTANSVTICRWQYTASTNAWADAGGGGVSTTSSIPGSPGVTAVPVTSGLMAEYRILPTESACGILDYSGNSRNATGCVGTAPIIQAGTGGLAYLRTGAVSLPASLNSALTVMLVLNASATLGTTFGVGSPLYGSAGPAANSVGLVVTDGVHDGFVAGPPITCCHVLSGSGAGFTTANATRAPLNGNTVLAWVMDNANSFDQIYINGTLSSVVPLGNGNRLQGVINNAGVQTTGNYQLGGHTTSLFGVTLYYLGNIYYAVFYNRVLSAAEVQQNTVYLQNAMASRGVPPIIYNTTAAATSQGDMLVLDGDSLTLGFGQTPQTPYSLYTTFTPGTWNVENNASNGMWAGQIGGANLGGISGAPTSIDPFFNPGGPRNAVIVWLGTNDAQVSAEGAVAGYCRARRLVGWKCFAATVMSHTGSDSFKNTFNTWMRQNWASFADGLIDIGADPLLGADGASASATWFSGGLHPFTQAIANFEAPVFQRAIARYYGNTNSTTATTYVAAALGTTATTAGSMSGNTATITFGATPANCQVGNQIVLAGITPAGYNTPAGHGWQILTRSATQITFYNSVSGLGAISVQGTGVCPQQQDVDTYSILNFGAGNFTLQSCVGYTGQNIYIQNINAVATTLVPFASETITPSATLAANTTAILQSQLVSSAAGGCNWIRLQ